MALIPLILTLQLGSVSGVVTDRGRPVSDAVVWLVGDGSAAPIKATIDQKNKKFTPHVLVVPAGSTIDFPNKDDFFHNVFADYNAKKFDLGMYPKGQTKTVTFDKPGLVSILCNMHSEMSAFVMVVKSRHYTMTDKNGRYTLSNVKPGSYSLEAWHESGKVAKIATDIKGGDTTVSVALARK